MAKIGKFFWGVVTTKTHQTTVEAELCEVRLSGGEKFLQVSTFGSPERLSRPKVSQTFQLDRKHAYELRCAIDQIFPREE